MADLAVVVLGCLVLGGVLPFMFQPLLGWPAVFRYTGWCAIVVLAAAVSVRA